ncbi:flavodoxin [bacterium]|nr:flavodoxin [bacterium]
MSTLIVYASTHGCTETCVQKLRQNLSGDVTIHSLKGKVPVFVDAHQTILIGGSIHAGMIQGSVKKFCLKHQETLLQKKVGLFLCCGFEGEQARQEFDNAFPENLRNHAIAHGFFGGAYDFEKMNFIQRAITKKVAGIDRSVSRIDETAIAGFAAKIRAA